MSINIKRILDVTSSKQLTPKYLQLYKDFNNTLKNKKDNNQFE